MSLDVFSSRLFLFLLPDEWAGRGSFPRWKAGGMHQHLCVCMCVPTYRGRNRIFGEELLQWRVQYRPLDAANPNPLSFILFIARGKGIA